jgi:hypothetical protein
VSALILDAGALAGVDRNDPDVVHLLRRAQQEGLELRTNPMVVAQVDATVALLAGPGDRIFTSDPDDLTKLVDAAGCRAVVVAC